MKEGEGISQRTYLYNPWTQTMAWYWPEGSGEEAGWRWAREGEMRTPVINVNNKNKGK